MVPWLLCFLISQHCPSSDCFIQWLNDLCTPGLSWCENTSDVLVSIWVQEQAMQNSGPNNMMANQKPQWILEHLLACSLVDLVQYLFNKWVLPSGTRRQLIPILVSSYTNSCRQPEPLELKKVCSILFNVRLMLPPNDFSFWLTHVWVLLWCLSFPKTCSTCNHKVAPPGCSLITTAGGRDESDD